MLYIIGGVFTVFIVINAFNTEIIVENDTKLYDIT